MLEVSRVWRCLVRGYPQIGDDPFVESGKFYIIGIDQVKADGPQVQRVGIEPDLFQRSFATKMLPHGVYDQLVNEGRHQEKTENRIKQD